MTNRIGFAPSVRYWGGGTRPHPLAVSAFLGAVVWLLARPVHADTVWPVANCRTQLQVWLSAEAPDPRNPGFPELTGQRTRIRPYLDGRIGCRHVGAV